MDENELDNKASSSLFSRYRSPTFQQNEIKALVQLVEKYKYPILNKATNNSANFAKEKAWKNVTKEFNQQGLGVQRSIDVLKTKWENLKRVARKLAKDVMEEEFDCKDEINKIVAMISAAENGSCDYDGHKDNFVDEGEDYKLWACDDNNDSVNFANDAAVQNESPKKSESPKVGFSPRDCRVLLQCVRQEKNVLFSKASVIQRHRAWKRIADQFNKQSPRKKSSKELSRKFVNMKSMANKVNIKGYFKDIKRSKYEQLNDDMVQKIKSEPIIDCLADVEFDSDDDKVLDLHHSTNNSHSSFTQDPLVNVHSSDSGLGSISDTKDITRLKIDLINYKMETARLQRKQIEEALRADAKERETRAIEQALRIRAARLEAATAERKLPPAHPALLYTAEETKAQQYIHTQLDIG